MKCLVKNEAFDGLVDKVAVSGGDVTICPVCKQTAWHPCFNKNHKEEDENERTHQER